MMYSRMRALRVSGRKGSKNMAGLLRRWALRIDAPREALRKRAGAAGSLREGAEESSARGGRARPRPHGGRAAALRAAPDRAATVQLGDLLDEGEPEAGALAPRMRARQRIELLEHLVVGVLGDAGAAVAHRDVDAAAVRGERQRHARTVGGEVQRVVQQVA